VNEQGTCLLQTRANPLYNVKGEFIEGDKTQQPLEVVAALYDYKFVVEDGSKRVHDTTLSTRCNCSWIPSRDWTRNFDDSKRPE